MTKYLVKVIYPSGTTERIPCMDRSEAENMARAVRLNARDMGNGHTVRIDEVDEEHL